MEPEVLLLCSQEPTTGPYPSRWISLHLPIYAQFLQEVSSSQIPLKSNI
jgi:hypothetical protein